MSAEKTEQRDRREDHPLVSVGVASYNNARFMVPCLDSLIAQTYDNIELIVCDDASTDDSYQVLLEHKEELEKRFVRVALIQNEKNLGIPGNANRIVSMCRGEYVKLLASDDMLLPGAITDFVSFAGSHPCDLIYSNGLEVDENATCDSVDIGAAKKIYDATPPQGKGLTGALCVESFIAAPTTIFPRETIEKVGPYDESLCFEDWEYWLRISQEGTIAYLDALTVLYRRHDNAVTHKVRQVNTSYLKRMYTDRDVIFERYKHYADDRQKEGYYNQQFSAMIITLRDWDEAKKVRKAVAAEGLRIFPRNKVKYLLYRLHLGCVYRWLTSLAILLRRCVR